MESPDSSYAVFRIGRQPFVLDTRAEHLNLERYSGTGKPTESVAGLKLWLLAQLIEARGDLVRYQQVVERAAAVGDSLANADIPEDNQPLAKAVHYINKELKRHGESENNPIESRRKRGYRFTPAVEFLAKSEIDGYLERQRQREIHEDRSEDIAEVKDAMAGFFEVLGRYLDGKVEIRRWVVILCAMAPFASLVCWNLSCKALGWPYWMGRSHLLASGESLAGGAAFVWGFATTLPVIIAARLVDYPPPDWSQRIRKFLAQEMEILFFYASFGGLAAFVFYNVDLRGWFESRELTPVVTEFWMVLLWSSSMSIATSISFWAVYKWSPGAYFRVFLVQLMTVLLFTVPAVTFFVWLVPYTGDFEQARGLLAQLAMTGGLVCGILLTLSRAASGSPGGQTFARQEKRNFTVSLWPFRRRALGAGSTD